MAYCVQADVQTAAGGAQRLKELSDIDNSGSLNAAVVAQAIAEADALIDSYIGKRVSVPVSPVPLLLVKLSARLAAYALSMNRRMVPEASIQQNEKDVQWLVNVSTGKATLGVEPAPAKSSEVIPEIGDRSADADDPYSTENMRGWS